MPSVGIMSMQRIFNYGSSLQAYALRQLIEEVRPDADVAFLDYEPGPILVAAPSGGRQDIRVGRMLRKLREYSKVDSRFGDKVRFVNHKRSYPAKTFPLIGLPSGLNRNFAVDLQVIGSDEVFNCVQSNTNVGYARELFGHASPAKRIASYAASFGNTTFAKIKAAGIQQELADDLSRFGALSVRDRNSQQIVESLTGRSPLIHLDPTLVYDFGGSGSRVPPTRRYPTKYIVVYGYSGRLGSDENAAIRRLAESRGARVLAFGGLQASADEFIDCDPFELLAYFRDADAVVTDTFHGTIFSILNEVPFATIIRKSAAHGYGNEEKLGYLLDALGASNRAWRTGAQLEDVINEPVDFDSINATRAIERQRTLAYLSDLFDTGIESVAR